MILQNYAKGIPKENFSAMTRLDHNRALYLLAEKLNITVSDIKQLSIWGNHSPTMVPYLPPTLMIGENGKIEKPVLSALD